MKKIFVLIQFICLLVLPFSLPCSYAAESERKDILLIAPDFVSDEDRQNEKNVILALSSAGYAVDYIKEGHADDYLSAYQNIIYLPGTEGKSVKNQTGQSIILGVMSDSMIRSEKLSASVVMADQGFVTFTDSDISEQGKLEQYFHFSGTSYESGIISNGTKDVPIVSGLGRIRNIQMNDYSSMLAKSILIRQTNTVFNANASGTRGVDNYLVLTGVRQSECDKLHSVVSKLPAFGSGSVFGILPENINSLSDDYIDLLASAEQKGVSLALDLSQTDIGNIDKDEIEKITEDYAEKKIFLSAIVVNSSQVIDKKMVEKLPSNFLLINSSDGFFRLTSEKLIQVLDQLGAENKELSLPLSLYLDGTYHNSSFGGNICIGLDLPEEVILDRVGAVSASGLTLSSLVNNHKADLYRGNTDINTSLVNYVDASRKSAFSPGLADRFLSKTWARLLLLALFLWLSFFVHKRWNKPDQ